MADSSASTAPEVQPTSGEKRAVAGAAEDGDRQEKSAARPGKRRKRTGRRTPAFSGEVRWESGMRVYDEREFARLRMPRAPHWSVVWSDLMMTMFILFAVLYIYQSANREMVFGEGTGGSSGSALSGGVMDGNLDPFGPKDDEAGMTRIYDVSRKALTDADLGEFARVALAPDRTVRIILTGDLLFDSGSAELKPGAMESLAKIVPLVGQTPYMVNVVGHTDDVPIQTPQFPSNWELSLVRAGTVARFLMEKSGIGQERFSVSGHASFSPVLPNSSEENRSANRRVEIVLTRNKPGTAVTEGGGGEE